MKVLRILLILLAILVLLVIGIGLFGPTGMDVSYTKQIDAPVSSVYGHVQDFTKWPAWSPWAESDPDMKVTYGEKSSGEGASYSWEGPVTGIGEMSIREAIENEKLGMDIGFDMGDGMEFSTCDMVFNPLEKGTEVTWNFNSSGNDGFMQRIFNVIMPSMLKGQYEKGLTNLEREAKAYPIVPAPKQKSKSMGVTEQELPGFYYVGKRYDDVNTAEDASKMKEMYGSAYGEIASYLGSIGKADKIVNPPISITHSYNRETAVSSFSPAMRVLEQVKSKEGLQSEYMPAHKAVVYVHEGSFDGLSDAYKMMVSVLMEKGYTTQLPSYEIYLTDPDEVSDESKLATQIVIPVEFKEE